MAVATVVVAVEVVGQLGQQLPHALVCVLVCVGRFQRHGHGVAPIHRRGVKVGLEEVALRLGQYPLRRVQRREARLCGLTVELCQIARCECALAVGLALGVEPLQRAAGQHRCGVGCLTGQHWDGRFDGAGRDVCPCCLCARVAFRPVFSGFFSLFLWVRHLHPLNDGFCRWGCSFCGSTRRRGVGAARQFVQQFVGGNLVSHGAVLAVVDGVDVAGALQLAQAALGGAFAATGAAGQTRHAGPRPMLREVGVGTQRHQHPAAGLFQTGVQQCGTDEVEIDEPHPARRGGGVELVSHCMAPLWTKLNSSSFFSARRIKTTCGAGWQTGTKEPASF